GDVWERVREHPIVQPLRPIGHLLAYYPLMLPIPILLFAVCWNFMFGEYDGFHVLWSPDPFAGILSGMGVALLLGGTLLGVFLLNQVNETPPTAVPDSGAVPTAGSPSVRPWAYWVLWVALLFLIALPAAIPCAFFNGDTHPFRINE